MSDESIFAEALAIPNPSRRAEFLDQACAGNSDLRQEVEDLLAAHAASNPLDQAPAELAATAAGDSDPPLARVGDRIGHYRIMEQIGEGGFGLVFVAEQQQPVRRKVALKVLKPGMDTRQVVARFEAERQALALMDHPNIAKVLDAGSTSAGRPYFVMELIRGVPISDYCDQQKLPARQRLELFAQVCEAVQHAHQKGIIHRDLKPTNVLVAPHDGKPVVKVIDFGVAKALGQNLTDKTIYTQFTQMIGTPLYMSPEQAEVNQLDVDTRSDVYSLGVLLYELLTGTTPLTKDQLRTAAYDEIRRLIREEDPPKPSTRLSSLGDTLSTISSNRGTEPARLAGLVRGELDWIVMKCLEKDRNRRYSTASNLAKDVRCYLAGEAVEACPPTMGYRLRKLYQRNRVAVMTTSVVAVALLLGIILSTQQAVRAMRAEQIAHDQLQRALAAEQESRTESRRAREESERAIQAERQAQLQLDRAQAAEQNLHDALGFLWGDVLSQFSPEQSPNGDLKVITLIDRACEQLDSGQQQHRPGIEAMIRGMAGRLYVELGQYAKSQEHLNRALPVLATELGQGHLETLAATEALARAKMLGRTTEEELREAIDLFADVFDRRRRTQGISHPDTIKCLIRRGYAYFLAGEFEELEKNGRLALEIALREPHGDESLLAAEARIELSFSLMRWEEDTEEANDLIERANQVLRETLGEDHPKTIECEIARGSLLLHQDRYEEGVQVYESAYNRLKQVFGKEHPRTAQVVDDIALSLLLAKNHDAAKPWIDILLDLSPRAHGPDHPYVARAEEFAGIYYLAKGDIETAETHLQKAVSIGVASSVSKHGFDRINLGSAKSTLAECRLHQKDWEAAESLLLESQEIYRLIPVHSAGKKHHWERVLVPQNLQRLVMLYEATNEPEQAAKWRRELEQYQKWAR